MVTESCICLFAGGDGGKCQPCHDLLPWTGGNRTNSVQKQVGTHTNPQQTLQRRRRRDFCANKKVTMKGTRSCDSRTPDVGENQKN